MFPNKFLCFLVVFATLGCSGEDPIQEKNIYSSQSGSSSSSGIELPSKSNSGPGPCDPAYVVEYIDSKGYQHLIEIPSICGPEVPFQGDPNPIELSQKGEVSQ